MKKLVILCCALYSLSLFAAGTHEPNVPSPVRVIIPSGGPAISLTPMINEEQPIAKLPVNYEIVNGADLLQARILSGEADIAVVPTNLAAILYAKTGSIAYAGTVVWGNLYCITTDAKIRSITDLKGTSVVSFGRGLTPDVTVQEVLKRNRISADDVSFEYLPAISDVAAALMSGKTSTAIVAEPVLSQIRTKLPQGHIVFDVQAEWEKAFGTSYPQAGIIITKKFLKNHAAFVKAFLQAVDKSTASVLAEPETIALQATKLMTLPPASIIEKAIPNLNIRYTDAKNSRKALEQYFSVLAEVNPAVIGGALPDTDFYYTDEK